MILAIGELLIDMVTTDLVDDLSQSASLQVKAGGSCANFAAFCSSFGAEVTLVAAVGKDGLGKLLIQHLEERGLATAHISRLPNHFTSVIMVGKSHATPEFIPYRDADYHIPAIDAGLVAQCDILHSTAFALSRKPAKDHILAAFEQAVTLGKLISVDWNYAEKIWGTVNDAQEVFNTLQSYQPLLKVSLDDVQRFWHIGADVEAAKKILDQYEMRVVCLTCGADGVWYREGKQPWRYKSTLPANVIDVTGAGDAFWSGFLSTYVRSRPLDECIDMALEKARDRIEQRV
jgi:sugar/nucleoside kinase (ribokinase family)